MSPLPFRIDKSTTLGTINFFFMDDGVSPALPVDGEADPSLGPPLDGWEYLKQVRWEANRLPNINVAQVDPRTFDKKQTFSVNKVLPRAMPPPPPDCAPLVDWQTKFLKEFNQLREMLNKYRRKKGILENKPHLKLPQIKDERGWSEFTFKRIDMNNSPLLTIILQLEEPHVDTLINYHIQWLEKIELNEDRLLWIFALLTALEKPLDPDTSANLRVLLRKCCTARSKVSGPADPLLPALNVVITIVTKFFGQIENPE